MDFSPAITINGFLFALLIVFGLILVFIWLRFFQFDTLIYADILAIILIIGSFFLVLFYVSNYDLRIVKKEEAECYNLWQEFREDDSLVNYLKWEKECN